MAEQLKQITDLPCEEKQDNEINFWSYWRVIRKRWRMIGGVVVVIVFATIIISFFMPNIYQAKAVIMPVIARDSGSGNASLALLAQQLGGLPGFAMPGSTSASEIVSLLKSNILREKIIKQYNLMPVLFYKQWDARRQSWKKGEGIDFSMNPLYYVSLLGKALVPSIQGVQRKDPDIPDTWDALRLLNSITSIKQDTRQNTITISADFHDPDMAAKIVEYFLVALTNYMSSEAKRVAATNRKYLEEQLGSTTDPFIKQKTYNMIAQQIETGMMAEVKENFAFKIIDPPLAPDKKIKPKRIQMITLSLIFALLVGIFTAFFREYIERIRTSK